MACIGRGFKACISDPLISRKHHQGQNNKEEKDGVEKEAEGGRAATRTGQGGAEETTENPLHRLECLRVRTQEKHEGAVETVFCLQNNIHLLFTVWDILVFLFYLNGRVEGMFKFKTKLQSQAQSQPPLTHGSPPPQTSDNEISDALKWIKEANEEKALKALETRGAHVGNRDTNGQHELMVAATKGYSRVVDVLLKNFRDVIHVDDTDNWGQTALYNAAVMGYMSIVDALLAAGANPNIAVKRDGKTALITTSINGNKDMIKKLIAAGADVNKMQTSPQDGTALVAAVTKNRDEVVDILLAAGADVNLPTNEGKTPLRIAIELRYFKMGEKLLAAGANPNLTKDGQSLLAVAFDILFKRPDGLYWKGDKNYDILYKLIDAGADVNIRNPAWDGKTLFLETILLSARIRMFTLDLATKVLEAGARVDDTLPNGRTALHLLCRGSFESVSRILPLLLEKGADVNARDKNGGTPLHVLAEQGSAMILERLLEKRPDVNAVLMKGGETPLFIACTYNHKHIVEPLLAAGANPNIPNKKGETPLFWLVENTDELYNENNENENENENEEDKAYVIGLSVDIVKVLLNAGADRTIRDEDGRLPYKVAKNPDIRALLKDPQDAEQGPPLMWQGWTRGDASMLDGVFGDEETAKNFALCPVCMKYVVRSEACMYMSHNCSTAKGYYHEGLYKKYKNSEGIVNWCTICGRICKGHNHFNLAPAQGPVPPVIYGKDPFAKSCKGEGGGDVAEKLLRFRRLREHARDLQAEVGKMGWWEAMDELCEEMWNAPMVRSRALKTMQETKKFNIPNTNFPLTLPPQNNAPNTPYTGEAPIVHPSETEAFTNALYIDDVNILQFRHRRMNGTWNRHEGPGQQISREGFVGWLKSMLENPTAEEFGKCWQYKTRAQQAALNATQTTLVCDAVLHPAEVVAALDMEDAEQARLAEGYRKAFNAAMDTRRMYRPNY